MSQHKTSVCFLSARQVLHDTGKEDQFGDLLVSKTEPPRHQERQNTNLLVEYAC